MKKQILFSLALFIALSSISLQAAEVESNQSQMTKIKSKREQVAQDILTKGLDIFGGSAMFLVGSWFIWSSGIRTVIDAVQYDKRAALAEANREYLAAIARQPENIEAINRDYELRRSAIEDRGLFGTYKLLWVSAGISLIYMGYKELSYKELEEEKSNA